MAKEWNKEDEIPCFTNPNQKITIQDNVSGCCYTVEKWMEISRQADKLKEENEEWERDFELECIFRAKDQQSIKYMKEAIELQREMIMSLKKRLGD